MENYLRLLFFLVSSFIIPNAKSDIGCEGNQVPCLGMCVDSASLCPVEMVCPSELKRTNLYTCSKDNNNVVPSSCKVNEECWDGSCQTDKVNKCPSMPTCPLSNTVKCPDNSCVPDVNTCPKYFNCPTFTPIRCPNGDCRRNLKDCPSLVKCPKEFTMLCNDGSCRMTSEECEVPSLQTQCADQTMTRCPDGTCTSSKFLCPTPKTCPKGMVLCWNGSCAEYGKCEKPLISQSSSCSSNSLLKCSFDGSCRSNISMCPTGIICPVNQPVKCWDLSCKESIEKCPPYQDCPEGTKQCPDGSCTTVSCGTHITCSMDAPFRCYDNTCRRNLQDCSQPSECPNETPVLCWDGNCVANRADCLPPENCPSSEPVKCPDNMCRKTAEECKMITDCPTGFSRCANGTCRRKLSDCIKQECPINFPYKCKNGMCVNDNKKCEADNGCPYYAPYKCRDGSCAKATVDCDQVPYNLCENIPDTKLCPDGSCLPVNKPCPAENGCPRDTPTRCADGLCIDPVKYKCSNPVCPVDAPVKCLDGNCVVTSSTCPSAYETSEVSTRGLVECADGTYAENSAECKPLMPCPLGYERCNDGTCRESKEYCPLAKTCPNTKKYRCPDGTCAVSKELCLNLSGCPQITSNKCSNSGLCADNLNDCTEYEKKFAFANGCDKSSPIKCPSGKCVSNKADCDEKVCPENKFRCNNGRCVDKPRDCKKFGVDCPEGQVMCLFDGFCMDKHENCFNSASCRLSAPFRCVDGTCKKYPMISNINDNNGCDIGIKCPDYKPYLCADGSCTEKSSFCQSLLECPSKTPYRCFDRTCVMDPEECLTKLKSCPARNPILCSNGNCVSNVYDCIDDSCPSWKPHKCITGVCATSPRECVVNSISKQSICQPDEATCYDGTCRKSMDKCPIYPGCTNTKLPYKCPDGSCATSEKECTKLENPCANETTNKNLCEDGICRATCPIFNGCPNEKPLMCSNGRCVVSPNECAGESNCASMDTPFRCMDGSCASSIYECKRAKRGFADTDIKMYVYPNLEVSADIIIGDSNDIIGSIKIPPNTFYVDTSNSTDDQDVEIWKQPPTSAVLSIKSAPTSVITGTTAQYNQTRQEDIIKVYPYADEANKFSLEYEYAVLSPVVEVSVNSENIRFKNYVILKLAYDFPSMHESVAKDKSQSNDDNSFMTLDPMADVCLAMLDITESAWECVNNPSYTRSAVNYELFGAILSPGIYAVILNPKINTTQLKFVPNFLVKYFIIILVSGFVTFLVIMISIYIFFRIYRYRGKYKETREDCKKYEDKMAEMQSFGTTLAGESIGDTMENIIFTNNPAFRLTKEDKRNDRVEQLQSLQESVMKRYRALEKNNEQLKKRYETLNEEFERLKEYKAQLTKEGQPDTIVKTDENLI